MGEEAFLEAEGYVQAPDGLVEGKAHRPDGEGSDEGRGRQGGKGRDLQALDGLASRRCDLAVRLLRAAGKGNEVAGVPKQGSDVLDGCRKTLEINANHPVIVDLLSKVKASKDDAVALDTAQVLFQTALIESGFDFADPSTLVNRVYRLITKELGVDPDAPLKEVEVPEGEEEEAEEEEEEKDDEEESSDEEKKDEM